MKILISSLLGAILLYFIIDAHNLGYASVFDYLQERVINSIAMGQYNPMDW